MTVGRETPIRSAISVLATPSAARSRMRARWTSTAGSRLDRVQRRSSAKSSGATESGGGSHGPWSHTPPLRWSARKACTGAVGDQMAAQHRSTHLVATQRGRGGPGRRGQPCLLVMRGRFRPPGVHGYDRLQPPAVHSCWPGGHGNHPVRVMCAWSPACSLTLRSRRPQRGLECSTGPLPDLKRLDLPAVAVRRRP
jgi:hypothetical protein